MNTKQDRLNHANQLVQVIAKHGRRFFYSAEKNRTAEFKLDERGRVWFVDDYTGKTIFTHQCGLHSRWRGFTHGGTLRALVEAIRDYIMHGEKLSIGWLGPERSFTNGNIWGYEPDQMAACRAEALMLPIIENGELLKSGYVRVGRD